ncbi:MAG: hypothetical protein ACRD96_15970, partial [Bryobacteraceae bacterium]
MTLVVGDAEQRADDAAELRRRRAKGSGPTLNVSVDRLTNRIVGQSYDTGRLSANWFSLPQPGT